MPTKIKARPDAQGKPRYRALYLTPDGRWLTEGTYGDRKTAQKAATLAEGRAGSQQWLDPRRGKITFASFVERVYAPTMGTLEASTRRGYESLIRSHLLPQWGSCPIGSILPSQVSRWVADPNPPRLFPKARPDLASLPRSPQRTHDAFALFSKIMSLAVSDGVRPSNPCTGLKTPTQPRPRVEIITPEEFDLLLEAVLVHRADGSITEVSLRNQMILLVATLTGLRWSELMALAPEQIDFLRHRITVDRAVVSVGTAHSGNDTPWISKPYPKGKKERQVPLDADAAEALSRAIASRRLAPDGAEPIFRTRTGAPISSTHFNEDVLKPALKRIGLQGRKITVKTLRASFCSWMLAGHAPLPDVQAFMGHQQLTTTQKYVQILPGAYDEALKALGAIRHRSQGAATQALLMDANKGLLVV